MILYPTARDLPNSETPRKRQMFQDKSRRILDKFGARATSLFIVMPCLKRAAYDIYSFPIATDVVSMNGMTSHRFRSFLALFIFMMF